MDSLAHTTPIDLEISNGNCATANSAIDNEIVSLPTQKSSTKIMLLPTQKLAVTVESFLDLLFFLLRDYNICQPLALLKMIQ
jgi:hypothetical protein